jgi:hypothetical protein
MPDADATDDAVQRKWDRFAVSKGNDHVELARFLLTAPVDSATRAAPAKTEVVDSAETAIDIGRDQGPFE